MRVLLEKILRNLGIPDRIFVEKSILTYSRILQMENYANNSLLNGVSDTNLSQADAPIVVSLTTYGKRIYDVHLTIESIFQQTVHPNKLILWLDKAEFNEDNIPNILKKQRERGLTIAFCSNLKSYKKLIPTLKKHPDSVIITIDDDTIYPFDLLERLLKAYVVDKHSVYFTRGCKIKMDKRGNVLPYRQWDRLGNDESQDEWPIAKELREGTPLALPTGVGGVLYPPNCFHEDVMREDLFMSLCPNADDLWFKAMTYKNNVLSKLIYMEKSFSRMFLTIPNSQEISLAISNLKNSNNDPQLMKILEHYTMRLEEK